ncbi:hypothetical protein VIBNISO65_880008 [Vibrio nigripulchritudo SO65]|nr:hypothetical protein VIBNIFTn2_780008 [Vibrio nigripulchritudo FTn2]CCN62968.1 hypothetical protein VIBNIPon4_1060015 [Vibrio nigripulchritudo POn4]CCN79267.1 hypothetical protein VIBNISO65_880008 [Vibrio nigripulchritudo SO65]CCN85497.1 hypothetical protein VIBNIBLFn1_940035 [Vibrio nigripulchritudo BLFn1]CCO43222.1 hypothetical protein VIBNISFn135_940035 [Vibrio nigripulchritudo SFn135]BCL71362.1 hypothetical protein VNTUMSATTG_32990 [Vibrio nigripulchritudo]
MGFNNVIGYVKPLLFTVFCQQGYQLVILMFGNIPALVAYEKMREVFVSTKRATRNKTVRGLDAVDEALLQ